MTNDNEAKEVVTLREGLWRSAWDAANAAGRTAINSLLLASGGAVVALLAFLGNLLSKDTSHDYFAQARISLIVRDVAFALQPFVISLFAAVVAASFTYLSMLNAAEGVARESSRFLRAADVLNWLAIFAGVVSLGSLAYGSYVGLRMLHTL